MTQRVILVLSLDLDGDPQQVADGVSAAVEAINPPAIPGFSGELRISVEPVSRQVETWLDEGGTLGRGAVPVRPHTFGPGPANRAERRRGIR